MSNEYFNKPADIEAQTRALHTSVNTLSQATDQGFDAIPTNLSGLKSEVEAARDGFSSLLNKQQDQDTKIEEATVIATSNYPDQTGNAGKVLKTDGTIPYWENAIDDGLIATDKAWSSDKINKSLIGISPRIYFMGGF